MRRLFYRVPNIEHGIFILWFALILSALLLLGGLALDSGNLYVNQTRLQRAVDAAVIAHVDMVNLRSQEFIEESVNQTIRNNLRDMGVSQYVLHTPEVQIIENKIFRVRATMEVDLFLLRVFPFMGNFRNVRAVAGAARRPVAVVLILDATGSMGANPVLDGSGATRMDCPNTLCPCPMIQRCGNSVCRCDDRGTIDPDDDRYSQFQRDLARGSIYTGPQCSKWDILLNSVHAFLERFQSGYDMIGVVLFSGIPRPGANIGMPIGAWTRLVDITESKELIYERLFGPDWQSGNANIVPAGNTWIDAGIREANNIFEEHAGSFPPNMTKAAVLITDGDALTRGPFIQTASGCTNPQQCSIQATLGMSIPLNKFSSCGIPMRDINSNDASTNQNNLPANNVRAIIEADYFRYILGGTMYALGVGRNFSEQSFLPGTSFEQSAGELISCNVCQPPDPTSQYSVHPNRLYQQCGSANPYFLRRIANDRRRLGDSSNSIPPDPPYPMKSYPIPSDGNPHTPDEQYRFIDEYESFMNGNNMNLVPLGVWGEDGGRLKNDVGDQIASLSAMQCADRQFSRPSETYTYRNPSESAQNIPRYGSGYPRNCLCHPPSGGGVGIGLGAESNFGKSFDVTEPTQLRNFMLSVADELSVLEARLGE